MSTVPKLELYDQAIKAYKKATEAKPELLPAWQGISSFYEKKKDVTKEDLEDLAGAYEKILKFFETIDDMKKYYLTSEKLVTLHYEKLGHFHNAIKVIQDRIRVCMYLIVKLLKDFFFDFLNYVLANVVN